MSRSRRKNSICGWTCAESEKRDKQLANRAFRRRVKGALITGRPLPDRREIREVYMFGKDGKQRFDINKHPEAMRK